MSLSMDDAGHAMNFARAIDCVREIGKLVTTLQESGLTRDELYFALNTLIGECFDAEYSELNQEHIGYNSNIHKYSDYSRRKTEREQSAAQ